MSDVIERSAADDEEDDVGENADGDDHGGSVEDLLAEDDYGDLYEEEADADEAPTADDGEQGAAKEGSSGAGAPGSHEQVGKHVSASGGAEREIPEAYYRDSCVGEDNDMQGSRMAQEGGWGRGGGRFGPGGGRGYNNRAQGQLPMGMQGVQRPQQGQMFPYTTIPGAGGMSGGIVGREGGLRGTIMRPQPPPPPRGDHNGQTMMMMHHALPPPAAGMPFYKQRMGDGRGASQVPPMIGLPGGALPLSMGIQSSGGVHMDGDAASAMMGMPGMMPSIFGPIATSGTMRPQATGASSMEMGADPFMPFGGRIGGTGQGERGPSSPRGLGRNSWVREARGAQPLPPPRRNAMASNESYGRGEGEETDGQGRAYLDALDMDPQNEGDPRDGGSDRRQEQQEERFEDLEEAEALLSALGPETLADIERQMHPQAGVASGEGTQFGSYPQPRSELPRGPGGRSYRAPARGRGRGLPSRGGRGMPPQISRAENQAAGLEDVPLEGDAPLVPPAGAGRGRGRGRGRGTVIVREPLKKSTWVRPGFVAPAKPAGDGEAGIEGEAAAVAVVAEKHIKTPEEIKAEKEARAALDLQERLKKIEEQKKAQAEKREMERLKKLIAEQAELLKRRQQASAPQDGQQNVSEEQAMQSSLVTDGPQDLLSASGKGCETNALDIAHPSVTEPPTSSVPAVVDPPASSAPGVPLEPSASSAPDPSFPETSKADREDKSHHEDRRSEELPVRTETAQVDGSGGPPTTLGGQSSAAAPDLTDPDLGVGAPQEVPSNGKRPHGLEDGPSGRSHSSGSSEGDSGGEEALSRAKRHHRDGRDDRDGGSRHSKRKHRSGDKSKKSDKEKSKKKHRER